MTNRMRNSAHSRTRSTFIAAMLIFALNSMATHSQGTDSSHHAEYLLKAAFLYNIAKFVEWPEDVSPKGNAPLTLCVVGDAFGTSIDSIDGKEVRGHLITVRKNVPGSSLMTCHLLFLSNEEIPRLVTDLNDLKNSPVLTVCDSPGCAERGFMINLRIIDNKISLEINLDVIQRTPLKVSSQLLKLARMVKNERKTP